MSLRDIARQIAAGQITAREHIESTLTKLRQLDGTPWENLVVGQDHQDRLAAEALEQADALDEYAQQDGPVGPLHGVAVAVKDLIDIAGFPTRCGSAVRADAEPATRDADVVTRLRAAGAIVVAKTHLHEFAYGPTGATSADGPAANPHDPERIAGGSSSGSAGLVALGTVPLAIGTDTGCSVRTPAALCGITGFKPGADVLSTEGVFPLSTTLDHVGLLASSPQETAFAFGALTSEARDAPPLGELTVGHLRGPEWEIHDPSIERTVLQAEQALRDAGAVVVDIELPHIEELVELYGVIVGSEAYTTHEHALRETPDLFQPITRDRLGGQKERRATEYIRALRRRNELQRECFIAMAEAGVDAVVTATTPMRAPHIGVEEADTPNGLVLVRAEMLRMCIPFSMLGIPALSVPVNHSDGLPSGIQVAAAPLDAPGASEAVALALGQVIADQMR